MLSSDSSQFRRGGNLASFSSHGLTRVLQSTRYDTWQVRGELGWRPQIALQVALKTTVS
jgi:hypothetical protein